MPKVMKTVKNKAKIHMGFSGLLNQHSLIPISSCCPGTLSFFPREIHFARPSYSILFLQDVHFFSVFCYQRKTSKVKKNMLLY